MLIILINYDNSLEVDRNIPEIKLPYKTIKKMFLSLYDTSNLIRYNRVVLTIKANGKVYNIGFKSFLDYFQWYFLSSKYIKLDKKRINEEYKIKKEQEKYEKLKTFSEDIIKEFASKEYPEEKKEPLLLSYSDEKSNENSVEKNENSVEKNENSVGKKLCLIFSQIVFSWKKSKESTPQWKSSKRSE